MRTNIDIDDGWIRQAMRLSAVRTKKAAVEAGLRPIVKTRAQASIRHLRGRVRWDGNLVESGRGRANG